MGHLAKSLYSKLSKRSYWKNVTEKAAKYSEMETWEMRDGYLFRPYDKAESMYAEPEKVKTKKKEAKPSVNDTSANANAEADEDDQILKSEEVKRVKLKTPRLMIGDIRMSVLALDP